MKTREQEIKETEHWLSFFYRGVEVPLSEICERFFGLDYDAAKRAAREKTLPVPAYRVGSRQGPLLVSMSDLAERIVDQKREAEKEHKRMQAA